MATDNNNPIKYSDLVKADDSITNLIKQLDELSDTYMNTSKNIKGEALQITASLQRVSGATAANRDQIKKSANDTDKLTKAARDLAFAESDNAKKLADLKQAQKEANELNKLQVKLNQSAEGSYNKLSAQYSINKIYLNNMTVAERENTLEGQKLVTSTKKMYEEMNRLQKVTGKSQLNVGNYPQMTNMLGTYTNKLTEAIGIQGNFGSSLVSMSGRGDKAKDFFNEIGTSISAFGKTLLGLLANPVFIAIAGITGVGLAFKWWYDYNKGLVEASRLTKAFTGKSGDDMKAYRNEVQAVGDTFGSDFKDTLISTTALSKDFGITSEEALKYVKDGFLTGANVTGDYLNQIKQYGPVFKNMGVSASNFIAILSQTNKMGLPVDKVLGVFSMADKKIREMGTTTKNALNGIGIDSNKLEAELSSGSKTTFDAMKMVSEQISKLPKNSSEAGQAIRAVFGKNGAVSGLEFIKSIKDMQGGLDGLKAKTGELGKVRDENIKKQAELNTIISSFFDKTGGGFETIIAKGKLFLTNVLLGLIKGIVIFINYFVNLYNDSLLFRAIVQAIITDYNIMWNTVKALFTYMITNIKILGTALHGVFTLNFSEVINAWKQWGENTNRLVKNIIKGVGTSFKDGFDNINKKIKPIKLSVNTVTTSTSTTTSTTKTNGGNVEKVETDSERAKRLKKAEAERKKEEADRKKRLEQAEKTYKTSIEMQRKQQDAELNLMDDGFDKQRKKTTYEYDRQIQDLNHTLLTSKNLNKQGREDIRNGIIAIEQEKTKELNKIALDEEAQQLSIQKDGLQLRLESAKKGSQQELDLKNQIIENERKSALLANSRKPTGQQQDVGLINASFNVKITSNQDEYAQQQLTMFDNQQKLAESEFNLLKKSEAEKTKFKLQQEKDRWKKILEINATLSNKMSADEVQTIKNTIASIDQEVAKVEQQPKDIYQMIGLNLDDNQKQGIDQSTSYALDNLSQVMEANVQLADIAVQNSQKQVDAAKNKLDKEIEARSNGYANNVVMAQKEVDLAKKNQEKAQKDKEKAVKQQQLLDTVIQTSSLITASANIWSSLSKIPIVGVGLAVAALATMWGSFAYAKVKAAQVTKAQATTYGDGTVELLKGGSHQSGNDVDLGTTHQGVKRRAEGGEFFAVVNKRSSKRYRSVIPDVINSLNRGTFAQKYMGAYKTDGFNLNVTSEAPDIKDLKNDVREIRNQNSHRYYTNSNGETVEVYKNLRRIYKS